MGITQSIFKLGPPASAWQQIQIIATDNGYDDVNDDNYNDDEKTRCSPKKKTDISPQLQQSIALLFK